MILKSVVILYTHGNDFDDIFETIINLRTLPKYVDTPDIVNTINISLKASLAYPKSH
jgi:hypothetical protein